jgi:hypothetical protein
LSYTQVARFCSSKKHAERLHRPPTEVLSLKIKQIVPLPKGDYMDIYVNVDMKIRVPKRLADEQALKKHAPAQDPATYPDCQIYFFSSMN